MGCMHIGGLHASPQSSPQFFETGAVTCILQMGWSHKEVKVTQLESAKGIQSHLASTFLRISRHWLSSVRSEGISRYRKDFFQELEPLHVED